MMRAGATHLDKEALDALRIHTIMLRFGKLPDQLLFAHSRLVELHRQTLVDLPFQGEGPLSLLQSALWSAGVCVCVRDRKRENERERERAYAKPPIMRLSSLSRGSNLAPSSSRSVASTCKVSTAFVTLL